MPLEFSAHDRDVEDRAGARRRSPPGVLDVILDFGREHGDEAIGAMLEAADLVADVAGEPGEKVTARQLCSTLGFAVGDRFGTAAVALARQAAA